ncbi:hypothetical protein B0H14DRAFT_2565107 [Mycena olivaceomarginata]|nr:hypothetical protein B0H14DRAFT_2565107 [Mycena olivaceomarginata]
MWASCHLPLDLHQPLSAVNADIWLEILKNNTCYSDPSAKSLGALQYTCRQFSHIICPLTYQHVNLISYCRAIRFFKTVSLHGHLACSVETLQLTFNLKGDMEAETDYYVSESDSDHGDASDSGDKDNRHFVQEERLTRAQEEGKAGDSGDKDHRVQEEGSEKSARLKPEHVLSDHNTAMDQDSDTDSDLNIEHTWDKDAWCLHISQIPHIQQLIVTTPAYVVWPPSPNLQPYTEPIDRTVAHRIVLKFKGNCDQLWFGGFGNCAMDWAGDGRMPAADYCVEAGPVYNPAQSNCAAYCFGPDLQNLYSPRWLHVELEKWAAEWYHNQTLIPPHPGFGISYFFIVFFNDISFSDATQHL